MKNSNELNNLEKDALKEIGNIGTGNAATALSNLLNKHIEIIIPETKFIPISEFTNEFGGPEKVMVASYLEIIGDLKGESLFLFPIKSAEKIVDIMTSQPTGTSKIFDEMSQSAFMEMSNIVSGAYLTSLANFLKIKIMPNPPHVATDMLQSLIDFILAKVSNYSDTILSIKTKLEIKDVAIEGHFIILFDLDSMNKLLDMLKKFYGM